MSVCFLFVVVLGFVLILVLLAVVEISQGSNPFRSFYLVVADASGVGVDFGHGRFPLLAADFQCRSQHLLFGRANRRRKRSHWILYPQ